MCTLMVIKGKIVKNKGFLYDTLDYSCITTSMSTPNKETWTTLVQTGGLDKPVTLELVGATTPTPNNLFHQQDRLRAWRDYVLSGVHKIDATLECAHQPL